MSAIESISRVLESIAAPYALIGGRAVGLRGHPRMTLDYDFLTTDPRVLQPGIWASLARRDATIEPRKGDADDPLAGVVRIIFHDGVEADVILAKWKWQQGVIDRAEPLDVGGVTIPVPRTSDLILLKLTAGGYVDLQDVHVLLQVGDRHQLVREVEKYVGDLSPDGREAWKNILASP
ncbi:MAG TPA: hypothetical protein VLV78_18090 [Thermoanaerobaculia bacterium]|nr:hypothetical protein [Thermoanaerobaculia bacterium]